MNWKNLKVLVTGGAGFIGSSLVRKLVHRQAYVIVLDDFSTGTKEALQGLSCSIVSGDVVDANNLLYSVKDLDVIFHLGAPSSDMMFRKNGVDNIQKTVFGMIEICKLAERNKVQKLVYATSSSVYGCTPPPQSESSPTNPTNLYGLSKLICEDIAMKFSKVKNIGLRTFAGYGPGEERKREIASVVALFLYDILKGRKPVIFGDGTQNRDFIYIEDITDAFIKAAETDLTGVINVGSGESTSFIDLLNILQEELSIDVEPEFRPKPHGYFDQTKADMTKLKNCFEITPIGIRKGIQLFAEYAKL